MKQLALGLKSPPKKLVRVVFTSREKKDERTGLFFSWQWVLVPEDYEARVAEALARWPDVGALVSVFEQTEECIDEKENGDQQDG